MNEVEAKAYGQRLRRRAREVVLAGDCGTIVLSAEWQVCDKSHKLGIVDAHGMIDVDGPIARAFKTGFAAAGERNLGH